MVFGVSSKTADVDGVKVFYREAGSTSSPGLLLLHGHASGSHTFRNIIPELSQSFHVVAPDYPGFGNSEAPDAKKYPYTFANVANTIDKLTEQIGLTKFSIYIFDYGAPIGMRIATKHPERITGIFSQSGNAYTEGLSPALADLKALWANPDDPAALDPVRHIVQPEGITQIYTLGVEPASLVSPDAANLDSWHVTRPGREEIQYAMLKDYGTNVELYPEWQAYFREHKPKLVAVWGKNDPFFIPPGAEAFKRDLPDADVTILDNSGHFVNESHPEVIIKGIKKLL